MSPSLCRRSTRTKNRQRTRRAASLIKERKCYENNEYLISCIEWINEDIVIEFITFLDPDSFNALIRVNKKTIKFFTNKPYVGWKNVYLTKRMKDANEEIEKDFNSQSELIREPILKMMREHNVVIVGDYVLQFLAKARLEPWDLTIIILFQLDNTYKQKDADDKSIHLQEILMKYFNIFDETLSSTMILQGILNNLNPIDMSFEKSSLRVAKQKIKIIFIQDDAYCVEEQIKKHLKSPLRSCYYDGKNIKTIQFLKQMMDEDIFEKCNYYGEECNYSGEDFCQDEPRYDEEEPYYL